MQHFFSKTKIFDGEGMATGIQTVKHSHARVLEIANQAGDTMCRWLGAVIQKM